MGRQENPTSFVKRRVAEASAGVRNLTRADMRSAMTGRNAAFALGAALVVVVLWVVRLGLGEDAALKKIDPQAAPPAELVEEMKDAALEPRIDRAGQPKDGAAPDDATTPARAETAPVGPTGDHPESVEVDVSAKSVAVTTAFSGQQIVVFGAIHNSQAALEGSSIYDVVVVLEGAKTPLVSRRKSNVAGLWINTDSVEFADVPSYYAISATRPIEEITTPEVLTANQIGFRHVRLVPTDHAEKRRSDQEIQRFREAIVRLKANEGLFQKKERGVEFKGLSLFRTSIDLPANVPIGEVVAKTYLFRDLELIAANEATFLLERQGFEALMYSFAFEYPLLYGIFAVALAVAAGLAASAAFNRRR